MPYLQYPFPKIKLTKKQRIKECLSKHPEGCDCWKKVSDKRSS